MNTFQQLLDVCKQVEDLADEVEGLPYPFKVRWRMACEAAHAAVKEAKKESEANSLGALKVIDNTLTEARKRK